MDDVAALAGELESAGVEYEIQVYSGAPHGFTEFSSETATKSAPTSFRGRLSQTSSPQTWRINAQGALKTASPGMLPPLGILFALHPPTKFNDSA